jgi:hypothetical protein
MKGTKGHRERKNGASHEQWEKQKATRNAKRGTQVFVVTNDDPASGVYSGVYKRVA